MDFDGVILDSMPLKSQAFATVYADAPPAAIARILAYQRLHGGVSRRVKFAYFERNVFGRSGDRDAVERLAQAYRGIVLEAVIACPFVPGALEFLQHAQGKVVLDVVSGTPEEELAEIIGRRGLSGYFRSVIGAPTTKLDAFAAIIERHALRAVDCAAIGDALTEYAAAEALNVPFIGVVPHGEANDFPPHVPVVHDLSALPGLLGMPIGRVAG